MHNTHSSLTEAKVKSSHFSHPFNEAGTFDYYCISHVNAGLTGTITVTDEDDG